MDAGWYGLTGVCTAIGLLGGYAAGRFHAHRRAQAELRRRAVEALGGVPDWERRAAEAESAAVAFAKDGHSYSAERALEIARHIRAMHGR